jgi:hypothetical protein
MMILILMKFCNDNFYLFLLFYNIIILFYLFHLSFDINFDIDFDFDIDIYINSLSYSSIDLFLFVKCLLIIYFYLLK